MYLNLENITTLYYTIVNKPVSSNAKKLNYPELYNQLASNSSYVNPESHNPKTLKNYNLNSNNVQLIYPRSL